MKIGAVVMLFVFGCVWAFALIFAFGDPVRYSLSFILAGACVIALAIVFAAAIRPSRSLASERMAVYREFVVAVQSLRDAEGDLDRVKEVLRPLELRLRLVAPAEVYKQFLALYRTVNSSADLRQNKMLYTLIDRMKIDL